jgi:hypothetical protein
VKKNLIIIAMAAFFILGADGSCRDDRITKNTSALDEQAQTEKNQRNLFTKQPPPRLDWSLERDNLINRFKLQNDRALSFFMYVFIEGVAQPVGYYQINKVSSVDSQLTNTQQIVSVYGGSSYQTQVLPSPAEDGSYGTNGNGVFGFTPEGVYVEHNMHYIVSTIPLTFAQPVIRLAVIKTDEAKTLLEASKKVMGK